MELGDTGTNLIVILAIVALLALNIFLRRRRAEKTPLEVALSLLSAINSNQKLTEEFRFHLKVKKFKIGSWQRNRGKIDFLDRSLHTTLDNAFSTAEQFNQGIDAAKKHKSTAYLSGINMEKLKGPLVRSKQGLEEWLQANANRQQLSARRGCLFG